MTGHNRSSRIGGYLAASACFFLLGCGQPLPPQADAEKARQAFDTALEAWKQGQSWQTLQERDPPIYFNDMNWKTGLRLVGYEVLESKPFGRSQKLKAKLALKNEKGETREMTASYDVDTEPVIVIAPAPF